MDHDRDTGWKTEKIGEIFSPKGYPHVGNTPLKVFLVGKKKVKFILI